MAREFEAEEESKKHKSFLRALGSYYANDTHQDQDCWSHPSFLIELLNLIEKRDFLAIGEMRALDAFTPDLMRQINLIDYPKTFFLEEPGSISKGEYLLNP